VIAIVQDEPNSETSCILNNTPQLVDNGQHNIGYNKATILKTSIFVATVSIPFMYCATSSHHFVIMCSLSSVLYC